MMDKQQVRTQPGLRVNWLGRMQNSREPFEERTRKKELAVEMEREVGGGGRGARGQNRNDLCSFVDGMKQNERRGEGEEGRRTEQGEGLRKQLVRMSQRSVCVCERDEEKKEGSRRSEKKRERKRLMKKSEKLILTSLWA